MARSPPRPRRWCPDRSAVFVPLLVAADAAFAELVDDLWSWSPEPDRPFGRTGAALLTLAIGGGLLLAALHERRRPPRPPARRLGRTECCPAGVRRELRADDGLAGANLARARARDAPAPLDGAVCDRR